MSSNYQEIIEFVNRVGAPKRQRGNKITDNLVVSYPTPYKIERRYRIFSVLSGRPVVNLDFSTFEEAAQFARYLDSVYHEFWYLLSEYPTMNIPQVCMWTVPEGIRIFVSLLSLENRDTITLEDMKRAYQASKGKEEEYTKFPKLVR